MICLLVGLGLFLLCAGMCGEKKEKDAFKEDEKNLHIKHIEKMNGKKLA